MDIIESMMCEGLQGQRDVPHKDEFSMYLLCPIHLTQILLKSATVVIAGCVSSFICDIALPLSVYFASTSTFPSQTSRSRTRRSWRSVPCLW